MHDGGQKFMELAYRSWTSSIEPEGPTQMQMLFPTILSLQLQMKVLEKTKYK